MGAKSKLTDKVQQKIVAAIEDGNYAKVAAEASGIAETTFYRWMSEGESAKTGKKREFWESVTRAENVAESKIVAQWKKLGEQDWRALMELLQRRYPERWANTQRIEVAVEKEMSGVLGSLEEGLDPQTFREVMAVLAGESADSAV
jgi:hypothetical protein